MATRIRPHPWLKTTRPDEVAETWEGVSKELYSALWRSLESQKPLSEHIDIENSAPQDAIGINSVSSVWRKFTDDEKRELNELAKKQEAYIDSLMKKPPARDRNADKIDGYDRDDTGESPDF